MNIWIDKLREENLKLIAVKDGREVFRSTDFGIKPMYKLVNEHRDQMAGGQIYDRVIGRGAALLAVYLKVDYVYGELMSKSAISVLEENKINYEYIKSCDNILNKDRTGLCPIEKMSLDIDRAEELLPRIEEFFKKNDKTRRNTMNKKKINTTKLLTKAGLLLALGLIIPMIFHSTGIPGNVFLPMHIPVLLAGFLLTPSLAFFLGILTPLLSSLLTGMPPFMPMGIIMIFELSTYALVAALLNRIEKMPKILSLILAMVAGRLVAGLVVFVLATFFGIEMAPIAFMLGGLVTGLPGIIIQLILVPTLVYAIERYTTLNIYW